MTMHNNSLSSRLSFTTAKTRNPTLLLLTAWATACAIPSQAAIIFSEDFEGIANGNAINSGNTNFGASNNGTGTSFTATTDTGDIFGNGTSNIYNQTLDNSANSSYLRTNGLNPGLGQLATYSVSYRHTGSNTGFDFRIGLNNDSTGTFTARATGGNLTGFSGFSSSTTYRFDLVANNTGSALTDYYGTEDLASGRFDLFVTSLDSNFQVRVLNDVAFSSTADTGGDGFNSISFQTYSGSTGIALAWDDVEVRDEAFVSMPIPEPSAALVGGLGMLLVLRRRR